MDCVGRITEILFCILCLTLVPAAGILRNYKSMEKNRIEVRAEELCGKIKQEKSLQKTDYEDFKNLLASCLDYDYELAIARRYVLPDGTGNIKDGLPVKIMYQKELEEEFCSAEKILLEDVFINISVYGKDGYFYTCGGEVW